MAWKARRAEARLLEVQTEERTQVVRLHRRKPRVVVRSGTVSACSLSLGTERRAHLPTIPGLGFRPAEDTIPEIDVEEIDDTEPAPTSHVRPRVAERKLPPLLPPPPRRVRPVTLIDGVHDDAARRYREEAERLVASGLFDRDEE